MAKTKRLTAADLFTLLQTRYSGDEWVILSEVRNAAGYDATRTADAIAMNMWPSRGLALHGFEIKVSRADWVRELRDPSKADAFMRRVDYWWLVVSDAAIVHDGELPDGWGLLAPRGGGLGVVAEPAKHPAIDISRPFLASLLRRAARELMPDARLAAARREGVEAGRAAGHLRNAHALATATAERDRDRAIIDEFEKVIGQPLRGWIAPTGLVEALAIVIEGRVERHRRSLEIAAEQLDRISASIRAVLPSE